MYIMYLCKQIAEICTRKKISFILKVNINVFRKRQHTFRVIKNI